MTISFVIRVSFVDFSTINLGKRVTLSQCLSQILHVDVLVVGFFRLFFFCRFLMSLLTMLPTHHEGKCQRGNPFVLTNQGYIFSTLTLKKRINNLGSSSFHFQNYYSPRDKRGNMSFFSMIDPVNTAFCHRDLQNSFAGLQKRAWHDQPIDQIRPLRPPI